ncbi:MAG: sporulation integral membrane protein YtvI, partial [Acetivibrio sp.]
MKGKEIYKKITVDFIIAALTLLFLIFVVPKAIGFFLPFVIGWIIAVAANPLVRFLEKKVKIV